MLADPVFEFLFPYQIPHVMNIGRGLDEHSCHINGSDTGTGKTDVTCAYARWKHRRLFVVCPKPVIENWFITAEKYGAEVLAVTNYEAIQRGKYYISIADYRRERRTLGDYVTAVVEDAALDFVWRLPGDALIVFDEAHKGKNHLTINSKLLASAKAVIGVEHAPIPPVIPVIPIPRMLILSATITDRIDCFRTAAYVLGLAQKERHAYNTWLKRISRQYDCSPVEAIHRVVYPAYGSRMRISDIKGHPDDFVRGLFKNNDIRAETYPMSPEAEREIEGAYGEIDLALRALNTKQHADVCPLVILLRARQRIEMLKVPTIAMLAMEYLLSGYSVVVFVNFTETITQLFNILDDFVQTEFASFVSFLCGGQSPDDRAYNIKAFTEKKSLLMLSIIKAGGTGINLQGEKHVSLISPTWSSIELKQVLGRLHRAGGGDVIQRIVYCKGRVSPAGPEGRQNDTTFAYGDRRVGVEELIAANLNKKLATIEWLNNGDDEDLYLI